MKSIALAAAALAAATVTTGAHAASKINTNGTVTLESGDAPFTFRVDYASAGNTNLDGFGLFTFTGTSGGNQTYNFDFTIRNQSSVASRLSVFGFDTNRNIIGGGSSGGGEFDVIVTNDNDVAGVGAVDICFKDAGGPNTCANGQANGVGGLARGTSASGSFSLILSPSRPTLTIEDFFVRFQGVGAADQNFTGIGTVRNVPGAVPEPATWAMMIAGFGLMGYAMRRRRVVLGGLARA